MCRSLLIKRGNEKPSGIELDARRMAAGNEPVRHGGKGLHTERSRKKKRRDRPAQSQCQMFHPAKSSPKSLISKLNMARGGRFHARNRLVKTRRISLSKAETVGVFHAARRVSRGREMGGAEKIAGFADF